ncbi:MAG TPA: hydrophobe/amphiphile efflux-3 (HAE3) family transporter, partial [Candidatus Bathyarchaeia archaeon]|nr:hydrophobe/amphiphile efflux-3 (HAE3) family transporter [Candidatus Bathyarchaeia archaeon]
MIDTIFSGIAHTVNRRPKLVVGLIGVIFVIALVGMTMITMQTGNDTYLNKNSPEGEINTEFTNTFNQDSLILIIETSDPVSPAVLNYMDRLETDIRQQQHITGATSVVDVLKEENNGVLPQNAGEINALIAQMPPAVQATVVPSNVLTLMQVKLDQGLSDTTETSVLNNVQRVVDQSDPPAGVTVEISGQPAFNAQMKTAMGSQMGILIGAAMVLMVIVMGLLFSYVSHRFLPVVFVGLGLTTAMGLMGLAHIQLNMAVLGAFPVMIGLGIDYAIQFHARLDEEARKGSLDDAVFMTVTRTGPAVMYAMLATSLGFAAMFVSTVPMIQSFGLVAMVGIMCCYCISLVGIPAVAQVIQYKPKPQTPTVCYAVGEDACEYLPSSKPPQKKSWSYGQFLTSTSVKIARNPVPILLIAALIAVIGFQIDPLIPIEANQNNFVPSNMPAKIELDKVTRILGSTTTADFYVQGARVTDLDTLIWIKSFQDYELAHHSQITSANSIVTYIMAYNGGTMPQTQSQVDSVLTKIPQSIKDNYISGSTRGVIEFGMVQLQTPQQQDLKNVMIHDVSFLQPPIGISVQPAGSFEVFTSLISSMSESKDEMTFLGFALIFVFLALVYRHFHAISPLIPIIFIVGWNAVMMSILGIAYSPLTATLGSMTIGVAAEYTILVMERYSEEEERLHDHVAAIQESVSRIGTAITVSGLATFFGFSALCLSSFPIISNFGVCTLIAVGFSLAGAIFIMPAVLSLMGQFSEWRERKKG